MTRLALVAAALLMACKGPVDEDGDGVFLEDDCDDTDDTIYPGAPEVVADGIDQDCDGNDDCYLDVDGDGFGAGLTETATGLTCGDGQTTNADDCDDADADEHPGVTWYADDDEDGYGDPASSSACVRAASTDVLDATDCDDTDADEHPGVTWYADADADTYGNPASSSECARAAASDVLDDTDCDDTDGDEHPGVSWYPDTDGDGFGDETATPAACARADVDDVLDATDCDDGSAFVHPEMTERCDFVDTDCNGATSEDGLAALVRPANGFYQDLSTTFAAGTASNPVDYETPGNGGGDLNFCAGTWYVNVLFNADSVVTGAGPELTTVHGAGGGSVFQRGHQNQHYTFRNLTITGGDADQGGGIYLSSNNTGIVENCVIEGNTAARGGGIAANQSTLTVINSVIRDNHATNTGGGLYYTDGSPYPAPDITLQDTTVSGNTSAGTPGIRGDAGDLHLENTTLSGHGASAIVHVGNTFADGTWADAECIDDVCTGFPDVPW